MAPIVEDLVAPHRGRRWAGPCGGRSHSAPTSAATPPRSAPAPTSWSLGIAARQGQPISFWQFTRYGLVVTAVTLVIAWVYVWLRYYAFL